MLLQYLPKFAAKREVYAVAALSDIMLVERVLGGPDYSPWIEEFFGRVAIWDLPNQPSRVPATLRTLGCIGTVENSSMLDLCEMLQLIWRAERFCSGYWDYAIQCGMIVRILQRMDDLDKTG